MHGFLHVGAVEIDACAFGQVVVSAGEAGYVPEEGALGVYAVDVEAGVYLGGGVEDVVE